MYTELKIFSRIQLSVYKPLVLSFFISYLLLTGCGNPNIDQKENTKPTGLAASAGTRAVELNWSGVNGATGYTVYWSNGENVGKSNGAAINTDIPNLKHVELANGIEYYYVVTAHTAVGESNASNRVSATPLAAQPAKPGQLTIQSGDTRNTLTWEAVAGADNYILYWSTQPDVSENDNRIDIVNLPFVHENLDNGKTYYYILIAENEMGFSQASIIYDATPNKSIPTAPLITQAQTISGQVKIFWQDPGNAETYDLYWNTTGAVDNKAAYIRHVSSPFTHTPLLDGQNYYYRIRARNVAGVSNLSNELQVTPPGNHTITPNPTPPPTPGLPKIKVQNSQSTLSWPPVAAASGYNIYWTTVTGDVTNRDNKIANVKLPYTHTGLVNGARYYYAITAINDGGESGISEQVSGIPQVVVPGVPTGVEVLAGDERVIARWTEVENASGYKLYINGVDNGTVISPHIVSGLQNGTAYQFQISALNGARESAASSPAISTIPHEALPNPPLSVNAIPSDGEVKIQWRAALPQDPNDPDEAISEYRVYYNSHAGVGPQNGRLLPLIPEDLGSGQWQLTHKNVENGQRHYYIVTAVNSGGESRASSEIWAHPQVAIPGAPSNAWAQAGDNQVIINFTQAGSATAAIYNLYWNRNTDNGQRSDIAVITGVTPGFVFTDGADANGNTYNFQISAFNDGGESPKSTEISATPQVTQPQTAPQNIQVQSQDGRVRLTWDPLVEPVSGYAIYWSTDANIEPVTSNRISGVNVQSTGFEHLPLINGWTYYYRIVAINAGGESPVSDVVIGQPQVPPPQQPGELVLEAGDAEVTLNWALVTGATSYTVYWHTNVEAPIEEWASKNGVLPVQKLSGLLNGQSYNFRLAAVNPGGESPLTNAVSAIPLAPLPAKPTGLSAAAGDTQVRLNWYTEPGLNYTIYWTNNADNTIAPVDSGNTPITGNEVRPIYVHSQLSNNSNYRYQITATNTTGEGEPSSIISAMPMITAAGAPTALNAEAGEQQVTLRWFAPAGANSSTRYTLYVSNSAGQGTAGTAINNVQSPFVHNGLSFGQVYYYVVTATTDGAESAASNEAVAKLQLDPPTIPTGVTIQAQDRQNTLQWQAVNAATNYIVEWSLNIDMLDITSATVIAPATQYVHSGLTNGDAVYYRVRAQNAAGSSGPSAVVSGTPMVPPEMAVQIVEGPTVNVIMDEDGTPQNFQLSLSANNLNNASLSWRISQTGANGVAAVQGQDTQATVSYLPAGDFNGGDSFVVEAADTNGATDTIEVNVTINAINDAPQLVNNGLSINEGQTLVLNVADISAIDVDNNNADLSFSLSAIANCKFEQLSNPGTAITDFTQAQITAGEIRIIHTTGQGVPSYSVAVSDGTLSNTDGPQMAAVDFVTNNNAPVVTIISPTTTQTILPGETVTFDAQATDLEDDVANIPLNIVWSFPPESGIADITTANTGPVTFSVPNTVAQSITLTVTDSNNLSTQRFAYVKVSQAPIIDQGFELNGSSYRGCSGLPDYCNARAMTVNGAGVASVYSFDHTSDTSISHRISGFDVNGLLTSYGSTKGVSDISPAWLVYASTTTTTNVYLAGGLSTSPSMTVWRYDSLGVLDTSFSPDGWVTQPSETGVTTLASDIKIDNLQRIVVIGSKNERPNNTLINQSANIWRLDASGNLDTTFGAGGIVNYDNTTVTGSFDAGAAISIDSQNRVVALVNENTNAATGTKDLVLLRLDQNGTLDTTFGVDYDNNGQKDGFFKLDTNLYPGSIITGYSVVHDALGNIYIGGSFNDGANDDAFVMRFDTLGQRDSNFGGTAGMLLFQDTNNEFVKQMLFNSAGELVVLVAQINSGNTDDRFFFLHIDTSGSYITTYANNGVLKERASPVSFGFDGNNGGLFLLTRSETERGWRIWRYRYQ